MSNREERRVVAIDGVAIAANVCGLGAAALRQLGVFLASQARARAATHRAMPPVRTAPNMILPPAMVQRVPLTLPATADITALRAAATDNLLRTQLAVREADLAGPLRALGAAISADEIMQAHTTVLAAATRSHGEAFTDALLAACTGAANDAGFTSVDVEHVPGGQIRIFALDGAGRGLVSEIRNTATTPVIESEAVGFGGGSDCEAAMTAFDQALARRGIHFSPTRRTPTGGVPQLELTKAFVKRPLQPSPRRDVDTALTPTRNLLPRVRRELRQRQ